MDLGEVAGARRTRYRGTAPHDTITVFGTPPFVVPKRPPGASAGQRKDIFLAKFPFLNPPLPWKPHFQPTPAVARR